MNNNILVTKRNGEQRTFDGRKIQNCARRACKNLTDVDAKAVVLNAEVKLYDGITTSEIDDALIKSARALIEQDPNYKYVAARLLLSKVYKEVFSASADDDIFESQYKTFFKTNLNRLIKNGVVHPDLADFNFRKILPHIKPERDLLFGYEGLDAIADRYLFRIDDKIVEAPQSHIMRVAMGLAVKEDSDNREKLAVKYYNIISQFDYVPSTPTLFYSGSTRNQLSSCFLSTFGDSIEGIFDGLHQEAQKSKFAGGLGMDITNFRASNSDISTTGGVVPGAVYFWKLFNDMLVAVNQSGKRRGSGALYLETWHFDIEDFLAFKRNTGDDRIRGHDINTANWIPDLFIKQVLDEGKWYLFSPNEVPDLHDLTGDAFEKRYWQYVKKGQAGKLKLFREVEAKELWKQMLRMLFETGHPWMTFKDPSNDRYSNKHEGIVHSSNLCTEILLHTKPTTYESNNDRQIDEYGETAVCNLGSINLKNHLNEDGSVDYDKLKDTIEASVRMLDNVIDINFYPTQEGKISNTKHRPVGLGSMGWHDVFFANDIVYDSQEAISLSNKIYEFISYHAILASSKLAKERGTYSTYEGSLWSQDIFPIDTYCGFMNEKRDMNIFIGAYESLDWKVVREHVKEHGMRNSNVMAIAPNATISRIADCSSCTEPYFNNIFARSSQDGDFTVVNEWFVKDMKKRELWNHALINKIKSVDGDVTQLDLDIGEEDRLYLEAKYKTAFQVDQISLLKAAAARGRWIDQGMSVNLFNDKTSLKYLHDLYISAWKLGLKTTYYLRSKGASQIEKASVGGITNPAIGDVEGLDGIQACSIDNPECESCQ